MSGAVRRERIADAVIIVLGEQGSRRLTHRAVDHQADLSPGSTSYYFRTRADLLEAAAHRLAELDLAALDGGDPRQRLTRVLEESLHGPGRVRTLARYELVLEASRRPELHHSLAAGTQRLLNTLLDLFAASTLAEAKIRARDLLAFMDGLLLANITRPESERQPSGELHDALLRHIDQLGPSDANGEVLVDAPRSPAQGSPAV